MGRGSRHSKNAGTMGCEGQTYNERRKLCFGTVQERLGAEAQKDFDACALSLRFAVDPVCTPEGVLYSREAILENILFQKKQIARALGAWKAQEEDKADKARQEDASKKEEILTNFHQQNHAAGKWEDVANPGEIVVTDAGAGATSVQTDFEKKQFEDMKAFWLPSKTPEADKVLAKPDTCPKCPQSGKKLRMKELVTVKFASAPKDLTGARYMCPVCKKALTNSTKIVVLKVSGDAICEGCYTKCVKPDGEYDGHRVNPKDVIKLNRGGTGFIGSGESVISKKSMPLGVGSGAGDIRGQSAGPTSAFGLRMGR
ncbi:hypothetical protein CYMTET_49493 [Cymbomonas tetramitiformis]|uniref:Nitric oxide synthase-interacting protein zinc-finger domain-containing protein n=1 Tax=Cymbomonas tetramitiformis TaxID=36881 RepID=A0AAE0EUM9_9CHLO|nr:hypothetical protein CYMTET_49493 [Cymbomonas tetramitiformis]|eukprot:gene18572-22171_t